MDVTRKDGVQIDEREKPVIVNVVAIALTSAELAGASFVELTVDGKAVGMLRVQE